MNDINLKIALFFAAMGWKIFAARWDGTHKPYVKWGTESSSDPEVIKGWAQRWPNCYFCVACQQSDITILDVDNKHGKQGDFNLTSLLAKHQQTNMPETLTVKTPSGGTHYYFTGASAATVEKLGGGLDTPVMAPLPGSTVPGKGVYRVQ